MDRTGLRSPSRGYTPHPRHDGHGEASGADLETTRRIRKALKTIEVALPEHVIVPPNAALSFREEIEIVGDAPVTARLTGWT